MSETSINPTPEPSSVPNWHPFLSRTKAFLTFEEVYGTAISYDEIVRLIESLPTLYWIRMASMGSIFMDHFQNDYDKQPILFHALCPSDLLSRSMQLKTSGQRYLFHRMQFLALFRIALLHSLPSSISLPTEDERREVTARCLLALSSLLHKSAPAEEEREFDIGSLVKKLSFNSRKTLTNAEKIFLMNLVHIYYNHLGESMSSVLGRYKDMLFDIPNDSNFNPQGVTKNLLVEVLQKERGLTTSQYAALTFGLSAKYIDPEKAFTKEFYFPVNKDTHFSNTAISKQTVDSYFATISQSQSEFIDKERASNNLPGEIADFRHFMLKPLIHLDDDKDCYPTSLRYLQRLLDSALTWVAKGGEYDEDLRNYWGQVFEFYCHKVCQRIKANSLTKPEYFTSQEYGRIARTEKSCDAVLVYGKRAVLLEFKIKSPKLMSSIVERDYESFVTDIRDCFIGGQQGGKAASQIDNTIRAIRSCDLRLPRIAAGTITAYYPVVVTLQSWPLNPLVYDLIRMIVQKEGLLRQDYVAPLEIWSIEEFEFVEAILASEAPHPTDIPSLIAEKLLSQYLHMPMSTFLYDKYSGQVPSNAYVDNKREEMFEIILDTLALSE